MNSFSVQGNVGQDPELKEVGNSEVAEFSIADRQYEGPEREATVGWYRCQVWGPRAHTVMEFIRKGSSITVFGALKQRKYQTQSGEDRVSMDIRVNDFTLPARQGGDNGDSESRSERGGGNRQDARPRRDDRDDRDDRGRNDRRNVPQGRSGGSNGGGGSRRGRDEDFDNDLDDVPF